MHMSPLQHSSVWLCISTGCIVLLLVQLECIGREWAVVKGLIPMMVAMILVSRSEKNIYSAHIHDLMIIPFFVAGCCLVLHALVGGTPDSAFSELHQTGGVALSDDGWTACRAARRILHGAGGILAGPDCVFT